MKTRVLIALLGALAVRAVASACGPEMPVPVLADYAAQVIVAEVASARSYWAEDPRRIETELVLKDVEYLKGAYDGASRTMTLIVPGGTVRDAGVGGEWGMRVCCAPEDRAGERWVLFVLPTCKVHPVVGMERGSFRLVRDEQGVERVHAADGRAIGDVSPEGAVRYMASAGGAAVVEPKSQRGVRVMRAAEDAAGADEAAMSLEAFEAAIAPALAQSRDYHLAEPAGGRVEADHRAVPIKRAGEVTP